MLLFFNVTVTESGMIPSMSRSFSSTKLLFSSMESIVNMLSSLQSIDFTKEWIGSAMLRSLDDGLSLTTSCFSSAILMKEVRFWIKTSI